MTRGSRLPVTAIVCTRDERPRLARCLNALARFDQRLVVDSRSADGTAALARSLGAEVVDFDWDGRYPKKKAWSIAHPAVRHHWVLQIDADEEATPALVDEIEHRLATSGEHAGFFVTGRPVLGGRVLRRGLANRKLMLFDRRRTTYPVADDLGLPFPMEMEGHYQPVVDGAVGRLSAPLLHHVDDMAAHLAKHARYAHWLAHMRAQGRLERLDAMDRPGRRGLKRLFAHLPARPLVAFLYAYVVRGGFLDGRAGFDHALVRSLYELQATLIERDARTKRRTSDQVPGDDGQAARRRALVR